MQLSLSFRANARFWHLQRTKLKHKLIHRSAAATHAPREKWLNSDGRRVVTRIIQTTEVFCFSLSLVRLRNAERSPMGADALCDAAVRFVAKCWTPSKAEPSACFDAIVGNRLGSPIWPRFNRLGPLVVGQLKSGHRAAWTLLHERSSLAALT
jgi:hypothetical protein